MNQKGKTRMQVNSDVHHSPALSATEWLRWRDARGQCLTQGHFSSCYWGRVWILHAWFVQIRDETQMLLLELVCHFQEVQREPLCEITHPAQTFFFVCEIVNELFFYLNVIVKRLDFVLATLKQFHHMGYRCMFWSASAFILQVYAPNETFTDRLFTEFV